MILESIATALAGGGLGGITGLVGVALQQWGESKKRAHDVEMAKLQNDQVLALKKSDDDQQIKLAQLTADAQKALADINADVRAQELSSSDLQAAFSHDRATYSSDEARSHNPVVIVLMGIVDFLRGIIRPGITVYGMVLLTIMVMWIRDMHMRSQLPLSSADLRELVMQIIGTATYVTATAVAFWFGGRPIAKK